MEIEVIKLTKREIPLQIREIKKKTIEILKLLEIEEISLNIVLVSDPYIKRLNRQFLKKDRPTDVLSFGGLQMSKERGDIFLGEVVISIDTVKRNAKIYGNSLEKEFYYCLIHGILHLLGYDDRTNKERKKMEKKQEELLPLILKNEE